MSLYTRRVRVRKSRNGRVRKTYGSWNKQARVFNRARSEIAVSRTIFKTTSVSDLICANYGGADDVRSAAVMHTGCAGLLFQDARWAMFKTQFDEFRIVGVKYVVTTLSTEGKPIQMLTSFDRSAAVTADWEHYLTYDPEELQNATVATDLCLTNPSCRETIGQSSNMNTQVISIFPVTPMEKQWIGTAFIRGVQQNPVVTPTFMSAFNPKLTICALPIGRNAEAEPVTATISISTELYIETRGSKMKRGD